MNDAHRAGANRLQNKKSLEPGVWLSARLIIGNHLNSLTDMSNAFSCTKRETMEEANEQMMAQRLRNGVVSRQGNEGDFTFMTKHGLLMGTSEAPRVFSRSFDKIFKRWKLSHHTPPLMMLAAPFAVTVNNLVSPTTCSSKSCCPSTQRIQPKTSS